MLETFALIQLAVNLAVILGVVRLLRERRTSALQACQREERLEALAAELCAMGRDLVRPAAPTLSSRLPAAEPAMTPAGSPEEETPRAEQGESGNAQPESADRFRGAAALLERGLPIEAVAARTALLPGEVEVLRNLRRASGSSPEGGAVRQPPPAKRGGRARPHSVAAGGSAKLPGVRAGAHAASAHGG